MSASFSAQTAKRGSDLASMPRRATEQQTECLHALWLIRNTWDRRMRAFVRPAIHAAIATMRGGV